MNAKQKLTEELKNCNNMSQVLDTVQKYYYLDKPFTVVNKILVVNGVSWLLEKIKAAPRTEIIK